MSPSQLTNSNLFQRGWPNHQISSGRHAEMNQFCLNSHDGMDHKPWIPKLTDRPILVSFFKYQRSNFVEPHFDLYPNNLFCHYNCHTKMKLVLWLSSTIPLSCCNGSYSISLGGYRNCNDNMTSDKWLILIDETSSVTSLSSASRRYTI